MFKRIRQDAALCCNINQHRTDSGELNCKKNRSGDNGSNDQRDWRPNDIQHGPDCASDCTEGGHRDTGNREETAKRHQPNAKSSQSKNESRYRFHNGWIRRDKSCGCCEKCLN